ncbi:MAG: PH domain-containing protein [Pirellulales bacterium]
MKCDECGRDAPAESAFCPKCGARLEDISDEEDGSDGDALAPQRQFSSAGGRGGTSKQPPEEELWSGTYSPQAMVGPAAALAILTVLGFIGGSFAGGVGVIAATIGAIALWIIFGLVLLYRRMTVHYRLTTFRLFHESGLLSRNRDRIEVIDINDVTLRQGFVERMFNVGTIHIESSDATDPELDMLGIDNVRHVADLIDNTRRAERQRRAVFMENVGRSPGAM